MRLYFLLLALLLLTSVHAQTLAYEGWVYSDQTFTLDDNSYRIIMSTDGEEMLIKSNVTSGIVDKGECISDEKRKYCYNITGWDGSDYKAYMYVYYLLPKISIEKTMSKNILSLGETAFVTLNIRNTGASTAKDVELSDDYPKNIKITDVEGGTLRNDTVIWQGTLEEGDSHDITFTIKSVGHFDAYKKAQVTYHDGFQKETAYSENIHIYSEKVFDASLQTDDEDYEVGADIPLTLDITNRGEERIEDIRIAFIFPQSIEIEEYDKDLMKEDGKYIWSGDIGANHSKEIEFTLQGKEAGLQFVAVEGTFTYEDKIYDVEDVQVGFVTHDEDIEILPSIADGKQVKSNQYVNIFVKVTNKNSFRDLKNVKAHITSDLIHFPSGYAQTVPPNKTSVVYNAQVKIPEIETDMDIPIHFNITYTLGENDFSRTLKRTLVAKSAQPLQFSVDAPGSVKEGEPAQITATVINKGTPVPNIKLESIIPLTTKGSTGGTFTLDTGEEKEYSFQILPGVVQEETKYNLTFRVTYMQNYEQFTISRNRTLTVTPNIPSIIISKKAPDLLRAGEKGRIQYTLENKDTVPVTEISITADKSHEFDILGTEKFYVNKLKPGEKTTIEGEMIRAKKEGTLHLGRSTLTFKDQNARFFNLSTGSPAVHVKGASFSGPVILMKKSAPDAYRIGSAVQVTINLTNLGDETATGVLSDDNIEIEIPPKDTKSYITNQIPENGKIEASVFTYGDIKAYSNALTLRPSDQDAALPEETDQEETPQDSSKGIIGRFIGWLRKFF